MSSRRLDISSLLCPDDVPQQPHQQHIPVADPVVLAPHLRNPNLLNTRAVNQRTTLASPAEHDDHHRRPSLSPPIPSRRYQSDTLPPAHYQPLPLHSPGTYASPSPASPYTWSAHVQSLQSPAHHESTSPLTFFQSSQLPSPYNRPSTSSTSYHLQPHFQQSTSRTHSIPHSRSTSNPTPVSAHPFSGSSPTSGSTPTSLSSPLSSSRSPHAQKGNMPFVGLEALVHVASQESRRLSVSSSASPADKHSSISPIMNSPLHRPMGVLPLPTPPPPHWQIQHQEDKWRKVSPASEEPIHRTLPSPAFPPHLLPRHPGIPDGNFISVTEHHKHKVPVHIQSTTPSQRLLLDSTTAVDSGKHTFSAHSSRPFRPPRVGLERILANDPPSPILDDPSSRTRLVQPQHYLVSDSGSSHRLPFPLVPPLPPPHSWPEIDNGIVNHPDHDANREQVPSRRGLALHEPERSSGRDVLISPIYDVSAPDHLFPRQPQPSSPTITQHGQDISAVSSQSSGARDMLKPKGQRRRIKNPMDTSDDRPRKKQRSSRPADVVEHAVGNEEEHLHRSNMISRQSTSTTIPIREMHTGTETRSIPLYQIPGAENVKLTLTSNLPSENRGQSRSKSSIADLLNAEPPTQESIHFQPASTALPLEKWKPSIGVELSEPPKMAKTLIEPAREEESDRPGVAVKKQETHEQGPHEWLLEHYDDLSAPDSGVATPSAVVSAPTTRTQRASPHTRASSIRSKTFEQELEEVAGMVLPRANNDPEADTDIDIVTELVAETLEEPDRTVTTMDVEDELLSLVGDRPVVHHSSGYLPSAPSPLSQQHPPPDACRSSSSPDKDGLGKIEPPPASPAVAISMSSPLSHPSPATGVNHPETSSVVERGSISSSAGNVIGGSGTTRKGESAVGKKEKTLKSAPKAKPPPKPRAKPAPKAKSKIPPDVSASGSTGKGAKNVSTPVTAVLLTVKKSISAGVSRSRSTSVMPRGSVGPDGDYKADADETAVGEDDRNHEDDKLYCVCKTKYDEDRVMIACDRCDEWYHTQCVDMPDLEIDLVDQFICPPCIAKHPNLSLKTTYKTRCFLGLKHSDPSSSGACHKPARGVFSKYCSDECGRKYMQSRIDAWVKKGGNKERLWESVKNAEKREGVVVCAETTSDEGCSGILDPVKLEFDTDTGVSTTVRSMPKAKKNRTERDIEILNAELDRIMGLREQIKEEMEMTLQRRRLLDLASARAENVNQCGWDQRLCFGEEEWTEFGAEIWESYEDGVVKEGKEEEMNIDGSPEDEGAWWCMGKKVCERHAGWQSLRGKDVLREIQMRDEALQNLTSQEREIRKRIEDIMDQGVDKNARTVKSKSGMEPTPKVKAEGEQSKKVKKKAA